MSLIDWLMRPRVRRFRRWSFVVTVPLALLFAKVYGVQSGALVLGVRVALWLGVVAVAWRLGGERGEAVRDLLMHPRVRALLRTELDVVTALPRLLFAGDGHRYDRGTFGLAMALAFTPMVATEALVVHLLLGDGILAWVSTAVHAYTLVWLWAFMLGPRAFPHRAGVLRAGPLYRVATGPVVSAEPRRERVAGYCVERDGWVLLPVRGRVDLWIEFAQPVAVRRPLDEPLWTTRLAVASDDPPALAAALSAAPDQRPLALLPIVAMELALHR